MSGLSCSKQALDCMGSVVEMCGISCSSACGILALQPKIEPAFSALEGRFLTTGPLEKSREAFFFFFKYTYTCKWACSSNHVFQGSTALEEMTKLSAKEINQGWFKPMGLCPCYWPGKEAKAN